MTVREKMILELTRFELEYLRDNPDLLMLTSTAKFFAGGGFNNYTNEQLEKACIDNVWLEEITE